MVSCLHSKSLTAALQSKVSCLYITRKLLSCGQRFICCHRQSFRLNKTRIYDGYLVNARPILLLCIITLGINKSIASFKTSQKNCPQVVRIKMCRHHMRPVEITQIVRHRSVIPLLPQVSAFGRQRSGCGGAIKCDGKTDGIVITCAEWWFDGNG